MPIASSVVPGDQMIYRAFLGSLMKARTLWVSIDWFTASMSVRLTQKRSVAGRERERPREVTPVVAHVLINRNARLSAALGDRFDAE